MIALCYCLGMDKIQTRETIQTEETFSALAKALFNAGASHKELHGLLDLALDEAGEEQDKLGNDSRMYPSEPEDAIADRIFDGRLREHEGWPGDGSGMDDLADLNANEADDYMNE